MGLTLVGIDVGTSAVKGLAIDEHGAVLARAEATYDLSTPRPGWAEQDPADWWRATERVLAALRAGAGRLAGIGLSGQMHGLVALDGGDRVLRPAILWNDQRTAAECREIEAAIGLERLIALTGNRALPGFTAPKLLWMRAHEPNLYERIATNRAAEGLRPAAALRRARDRRLGRVRDAAARRRAAPLERRGARARSSSIRRCCPTGAREPGSAAARPTDGVPVAAGAGDQAAGAIGVGVAGPGPVSVALGTSGVVFAGARALRRGPAGARPRLLPRRPGRAGTRWA